MFLSICVMKMSMKMTGLYKLEGEGVENRCQTGIVLDLE